MASLWLRLINICSSSWQMTVDQTSHKGADKWRSRLIARWDGRNDNLSVLSVWSLCAYNIIAMFRDRVHKTFHPSSDPNLGNSILTHLSILWRQLFDLFSLLLLKNTLIWLSLKPNEAFIRTEKLQKGTIWCISKVSFIISTTSLKHIYLKQLSRSTLYASVKHLEASL